MPRTVSKKAILKERICSERELLKLKKQNIYVHVPAHLPLILRAPVDYLRESAR